MTTSSHTPAPCADTLLDAIAGLIGFIPERSLILIAFDADGAVNSTMRQDLLLDADGTPRREFLGIVENLATICREYQIAAVIAAVVDDRYPPDSPQVAGLVDAIAHRFADVGGVAAAYAIGTYAVGEPWHTVRGAAEDSLFGPSPDGGVLGDPTSSPTALERAFRRGRPVLRTRSELARMLAPRRHCDDDCCAATPFESANRLTHDERSDLLAFAVDAIQTIAAAPRSRTAPIAVDCRALPTWFRALTDLRVRDALLALAFTELHGAAELMWRELAQVLPGSGRASAATMLAHLHYAVGEGAFAGVALDAALGVDRDWSFAILLDKALRAGVRPQLLWEVVDDSYRLADELGVKLPEPTLRAAG